jgi:PIN domain nuclease of toxin-antitoxin system
LKSSEISEGASVPPAPSGAGVSGEALPGGHPCGSLVRRARNAAPRATRTPRFRRAGTGRCEVLVSVVSLWEIALLHDEASIRLPAGFSAWCDALVAVEGVRVEPLLLGDVEEARMLRGLRDPHDRLIAGTALRLGVALITADARMGSDARLRAVW